MLDLERLALQSIATNSAFQTLNNGFFFDKCGNGTVRLLQGCGHKEGRLLKRGILKRQHGSSGMEGTQELARQRAGNMAFKAAVSSGQWAATVYQTSSLGCAWSSH